MKKGSFERKIIYIALILSAAILVIFLALIPVSYSLSVGWIVGSGSMILTYWLSFLALNFLFSKKRSFKAGMSITMIRIGIVFVVQIAVIISLIAIDKANQGFGILDTTEMSVLYKPINIFTYMGGISVIAISTVIAHILSKRGA